VIKTEAMILDTKAGQGKDSLARRSWAQLGSPGGVLRVGAALRLAWRGKAGQGRQGARARMSSPLPPFTPGTICQKCGGEAVSITFHPRPVLDAKVRWPCWPTDPPLGEHLCRRCVACGHTWCEQVADSYAG
jgi:hypothetical protein